MAESNLKFVINEELLFSSGSSSGKSDFDDEYYDLKPPTPDLQGILRKLKESKGASEPNKGGAKKKLKNRKSKKRNNKDANINSNAVNTQTYSEKPEYKGQKTLTFSNNALPSQHKQHSTFNSNPFVTNREASRALWNTTPTFNLASDHAFSTASGYRSQETSDYDKKEPSSQFNLVSDVGENSRTGNSKPLSTKTIIGTATSPDSYSSEPSNHLLSYVTSSSGNQYHRQETSRYGKKKPSSQFNLDSEVGENSRTRNSKPVSTKPIIGTAHSHDSYTSGHSNHIPSYFTSSSGNMPYRQETSRYDQKEPPSQFNLDSEVGENSRTGNSKPVSTKPIIGTAPSHDSYTSGNSNHLPSYFTSSSGNPYHRQETSRYDKKEPSSQFNLVSKVGENSLTGNSKSVSVKPNIGTATSQDCYTRMHTNHVPSLFTSGSGHPRQETSSNINKKLPSPIQPIRETNPIVGLHTLNRQATQSNSNEKRPQQDIANARRSRGSKTYSATSSRSEHGEIADIYYFSGSFLVTIGIVVLGFKIISKLLHSK